MSAVAGSTTTDPVHDAELHDHVVTRLVRRERRLVWRDVALGILTPIMLLVVWQLVAGDNLIDKRIYTPPLDILAAARKLISSGTLQSDIGATSLRLIVGYLIGVVTGVAFGILLGYFRVARASLSPTFSALYSIPKIAILPVMLVIFGLGETPRILTVAVSTFFIMQINTMDGVRSIDANVLEAGRAYGANGMKLFRHVVFPASLPAIFTGLRVCAGVALIVVTATEFVASNNGLGYLIWNSWTLFQPDQMYVGLVCTALIGVVFTGLVVLVQRLALPWQSRGATKRRRRRGPAKTPAPAGVGGVTDVR